ncbi:MAG: DUF6056 family protein [Candidatus Microsaccharimonas sp.]
MGFLKQIFSLKVIVVAVAASILTYLVLLSYFVPLIDEDFDLYNYGQSFVDVIQRCITQYMGWNARIGDVLSILFSTLPPPVYNIFNGVAIFSFLLVIIYLGKLLTASKKSDYIIWGFLLTLLFLAAVFYLPKPNEVFFWRTGAANYFYPALLSLLYTIPLIKYIVNNQTIKNRWLAGFYIVAGVVIGHSNENVAPVMFALFGFFVITLWIRRKRLNLTFALSTISLLIGLCLLLFGPSTQHRIAFYSSLNGNTSTIQNIMTNFSPVMADYIVLLIPSVVIALPLLFIIPITNRKKHLVISLFAYGVSVASVFILLCAPYYTDRALFFSAIVLLIPIVSGLWLVSRTTITTAYILFVGLLVLSGPILTNQLVEMRRFHRVKIQLIQSVDTQLKTSGTATIDPIVVDESLLIYAGFPSQEITRLSHFFDYPEGSVKLR